jgi:hypothetical protein
MTDSSGNYAVPNTSQNGNTVQNGYDLRAEWGPSAMDVRHSLNFVGVYELPFGRGRTYGGNANRFLDSVFGGWKVAASAILYSGLPVTITGPGNSNTNNPFALNLANQYGTIKVVHQSVDHWFGTDQSADSAAACPSNGACAYGIAAPLTFGTAHNNTVRAPGYRQVDSSLFKEFHVWGENHVLGLRADFFNLFNIASYGNPDNNIQDTNFGQITNVRSPARQIQIGLHYAF